MNQSTIFKAILISGGGILGGVAGYLIAELVIYKLEEKGEWTVDDWVPESEGAEKIVTDAGYISLEPKNYSVISKPDLGMLATKVANRDLPNIISFDVWNISQMEKKTLTFYDLDSVFTEETDDVLPNPEHLLGLNVPSSFGVKSKDPDIVYIRNEDLEIDYEVIRVHGSYATMIMGLSEEEAEKLNSPRKKSRRKKNDHDEPLLED